ncbi:DUF4286 family protein [Ramlibacter agri]|uniref:DUF4286 family protein n=1 Tax=Ramlibacter agri TaxID=2728837 RepID=UPI001981EF79|nr:DUF4286 family protein [Ramlibacter agri]
MWWNMAPEHRADFEDWHTHEHFPERLGVPGFRRASRWTRADGGEGVFVLYELESHATLSSPAYLARLNAPTPWSTRLMPHHRNMVRGQTRVLQSLGAVIARRALTLRLSPAPGKAQALQAALQSLMAGIAATPGFAGAHLLQHETPRIPQTTEQRIRGAADQVADWVLVVCAYDTQALEAFAANELSASALEALGATTGSVQAIYELACSATPDDVPCTKQEGTGLGGRDEGHPGDRS